MIRAAHLRLIVGATAAALVLSGCTQSNDASEGQPEWLFTQTAEGTTYTANADGTGTLVLRGAGPTTTAFTNRPVREAHLLSTQAFTIQWDEVFGDNPPNATLVEAASPGTVDVIELLSVTLGGDGSDLVYTVKPIAVDGEAVTPLPDTTDKPVTLFIDPTLVELLVVIAIAGTLVGLLVPSLEAAADVAKAVDAPQPIRACLGQVAQSEAAKRAEEIAKKVSLEAGIAYAVSAIVEGEVGGTCDISYQP